MYHSQSLYLQSSHGNGVANFKSWRYVGFRHNANGGGDMVFMLSCRKGILSHGKW